ncbi:MAG: amidohydrolase family protein [Ferruginibacter sp.]
MAFKKFSADHIFDGYTMLDETQVLVTDKKGIVQNIIHRSDAGDDVQQLKGILTPGFINAHCHLELSHMKGMIPEHTGLIDFVFNVMSKRHFTEEHILPAIEKADQEMWENGIVAVGDICNNVLTIPTKLKSQIRYHNFIEVSGFPPAVAAARFEKAREILAAYNSTLSTQHNVLTPHAPYSVSPELFDLINNETAGRVITIHNQETKEENDFFLNKTGDFLRLYETIGVDISFFNASKKTSLQTWLPNFNNGQSVILVHNVHTSNEDIAFIKHSTHNTQHATAFCLCPNANLYITDTLPDVNKFIQQDCSIVLGTDSLASNHQLSILEEIKTLKKNFPDLSLQTLLQWASSNGARALRLNDVLGSFEKGKQPGIVLLQEDLSGVSRLF